MSSNSMLPWRNRAAQQPAYMSLRKAMDDLFDGYSRDLIPGALPAWSQSDFLPVMDVAEDEKEIRVSAELPGIDEKDVDVTLASGILTIKGEKKNEREEKCKSYHRVERSYGSFERSMSLPCEVDPEKTQATFKKGILTVQLAKAPSAQRQSRHIPIKAV